MSFEIISATILGLLLLICVYRFSLDVVLEVLCGIFYCVYLSFYNLLKWLLPGRFSKSVEGEVVLITGGGSGIGRLMALRLAGLGAEVVTVDVDQKGNEETVRQITEAGGQAHSFTCDLSNRGEIYAMAAKVKAEVGKTVSILINNAGIASGKFLLDTPDDKIELTFKVNVLAHFWTIKAFLPDMVAQQKGHVVNIASLAGKNGTGKLVDYCSSKFAAVGLDDALREELKMLGQDAFIKTTLVCPYYINTGMFDGVQSKVINIQEPSYVVDRAVDAILTDTEIVIVPSWTQYLLVLKSILPTMGYGFLANAIGINSALDHVKGRADKRD